MGSGSEVSDPTRAPSRVEDRFGLNGCSPPTKTEICPSRDLPVATRDLGGIDGSGRCGPARLFVTAPVRRGRHAWGMRDPGAAGVLGGRSRYGAGTCASPVDRRLAQHDGGTRTGLQPLVPWGRRRSGRFGATLFVGAYRISCSLTATPSPITRDAPHSAPGFHSMTAGGSDARTCDEPLRIERVRHHACSPDGRGFWPLRGCSWPQVRC